MAFKSTSYLRSMLGRLRGSATYATSTTPKPTAYAPTADYGYIHKQQQSMLSIEGDFVPIYVALGMIVLSATLGLYTAKQQLMYAPNVRVNKKTRETVPEVYLPDKVVDEADKFIKKSFFRKVAHVQRFDRAMPDPIHKDVFAIQPHVETLKDVGIDPTQLL